MTAETVVFVRPESFCGRAFQQQIRIPAPQGGCSSGDDGVTITGNALIRLGHDEISCARLAKEKDGLSERQPV